MKLPIEKLRIAKYKSHLQFQAILQRRVLSGSHSGSLSIVTVNIDQYEINEFKQGIKEQVISIPVIGWNSLQDFDLVHLMNLAHR